MNYEELTAMIEQAKKHTRFDSDYEAADRMANKVLEILDSEKPLLTTNEATTLIPLRIEALIILSDTARLRNNKTDAFFFAEAAFTLADENQIEEYKAKVWHILGQIHVSLSNYSTALEYFTKATTTFETLSMTAEAGSVIGNVGSVYLYLSDYSLALENYLKAVSIHETFGNKELAAMITGNIGIVYYCLSDYPRAMEYYEKTLEAQMDLGQKAGVAAIEGNIGSIYTSLSDYPRALEYLDKALTTLEEIGRTSETAKVLGNIANVYFYLEDYIGALEYNQKSLRIFEEIGQISESARIRRNIGIVYFNQMNYSLALEYYEQSLVVHRELGEKIQEANVVGDIGKVYGALGDYTRALEYVEQSLMLNEEFGEQIHIAVELDNIGSIYANKKFEGYNVIKAEEYLHKAMQLCEKIGNKRQLYKCHQALAELYKQTSQWEKYAVHSDTYHLIKDEVLSLEARKSAEQLEIRRIIAENEQERKREKLLVEQERQQQQQVLSDKTLQLIQQTEMLQNFREELEGIVHHADTAEKAVRTIQKKIKELPNNVLNWQKFEENFRLVYPDFQEKLKIRFPKLTQMEVKMCCLLRIRMKSHEISTLLFLSERTIESHRYNLRKKLRIMKTQDLADFLTTI
jgi:tetratricopeptide (TPR) repeat protein/DNA-binding CsgD family transcriptional regulator